MRVRVPVRKTDAQVLSHTCHQCPEKFSDLTDRKKVPNLTVSEKECQIARCLKKAAVSHGCSKMGTKSHNVLNKITRSHGVQRRGLFVAAFGKKRREGALSQSVPKKMRNRTVS